jgi:adenosylmethionine-8-amino-7-oxononanoate aminotransferase
MAAIGITDEIYDGLTKSDTPFPHVFTYGGHPVSCAVALKTIEIIIRDGLLEKAVTTGSYIKDRLTHMQNESPYVGDVRGFGLYYGIELVKNNETGEPFEPEKQVSVKMRARLFDKGIVVGGFGPNNITLGPPLIISRDEVDYVLDGLEWSLGKIEP